MLLIASDMWQQTIPAFFPHFFAPRIVRILSVSLTPDACVYLTVAPAPLCLVLLATALDPKLRDAYAELAVARERMGRAEILLKYQKLMAEKFVRTEPLGMDRDQRRYWVFEGDAR